ncbi:uncharacterized protein LOC108652768 [Drosophila navojoa]|uniref:uncharacterized protein LOC108652768 n=1 Tax=Drosophila navojoa TaxID=7232 RepID=UPI0008476373|nr:uncharacterized protein LOC108652768 [Drosophila navojoa]
MNNKYPTGRLVIQILCSSCAADEILYCYECYESPGSDSWSNPLPVCSKLRKTPEFTTPCPNSTMCQKTMSTIYLQSGEKWAIEQRGCANQVQIETTLVGRQYEDTAVIGEPYEEGCTQFDSYNMLTSTIEHCFCRQNLCNSATYRDLGAPTLIICVLFLLGKLR